MKHGFSGKIVSTLALVLMALAGVSMSSLSERASFSYDSPAAEIASFPFELAYDHILLKVQVDDRGPFWFLLDTGNTVAMVDMDVARSLGLALGNPVSIRGGGEGALQGAMVRNSYFKIPAIPGFKQRIALAIPLDTIKHRIGHDIDGLLGADFIGRFVTEVDYHSKRIRLYDADRYSYSGPGESIPLTLTSGNHPMVRATILQAGRDPIPGMFVIDLGSGLALTLTRQFVQENRLLQSNQPKIEATIGVGAGGKSTALVGRVGALKIGGFSVTSPVTNFSLDTKGVMATSSFFEGNIGALIMEKFKVILDYKNSRMILERNPSFPDAVEFDMSGMNLVADGAEYTRFRIVELIDHAPAADAGLRIGDVITAIDGRSAAHLTLSELRRISSKPGVRLLGVKRGDDEFQVKLEFRRLV